MTFVPATYKDILEGRTRQDIMPSTAPQEVIPQSVRQVTYGDVLSGKVPSSPQQPQAPMPSGGSPRKRDTFYQAVVAAAKRHGVDPDFALANHMAEYDPNRHVSSAGARGPMQMMQKTFDEVAAKLGIENPNIDNDLHNIDAGVAYLGQMLEMFGGNQEDAVKAYNWGPGNLRRWIDGGRVGRLPTETINHWDRISKTMNQLKANPLQLAGPPTAGQSSPHSFVPATAADIFPYQPPDPVTKEEEYRKGADAWVASNALLVDMYGPTVLGASGEEGRGESLAAGIAGKAREWWREPISVQTEDGGTESVWALWDRSMKAVGEAIRASGSTYPMQIAYEPESIPDPEVGGKGALEKWREWALTETRKVDWDKPSAVSDYAFRIIPTSAAKFLPQFAEMIRVLATFIPEALEKTAESMSNDGLQWDLTEAIADATNPAEREAAMLDYAKDYEVAAMSHVGKAAGEIMWGMFSSMAGTAGAPMAIEQYLNIYKDDEEKKHEYWTNIFTHFWGTDPFMAVFNLVGAYGIGRGIARRVKEVTPGGRAEAAALREHYEFLVKEGKKFEAEQALGFWMAQRTAKQSEWKPVEAAIETVSGKQPADLASFPKPRPHRSYQVLDDVEAAVYPDVMQHPIVETAMGWKHPTYSSLFPEQAAKLERRFNDLREKHFQSHKKTLDKDRHLSVNERMRRETELLAQAEYYAAVELLKSDLTMIPYTSQTGKARLSEGLKRETPPVTGAVLEEAGAGSAAAAQAIAEILNVTPEAATTAMNMVRVRGIKPAPAKSQPLVDRLPEDIVGEVPPIPPNTGSPKTGTPETTPTAKPTSSSPQSGGTKTEKPGPPQKSPGEKVVENEQAINKVKREDGGVSNAKQQVVERDIAEAARIKEPTVTEDASIMSKLNTLKDQSGTWDFILTPEEMGVVRLVKAARASDQAAAYPSPAPTLSTRLNDLIFEVNEWYYGKRLDKTLDATRKDIAKIINEASERGVAYHSVVEKADALDSKVQNFIDQRGSTLDATTRKNLGRNIPNERWGSPEDIPVHTKKAAGILHAKINEMARREAGGATTPKDTTLYAGIPADKLVEIVANLPKRIEAVQRRNPQLSMTEARRIALAEIATEMGFVATLARPEVVATEGKRKRMTSAERRAKAVETYGPGVNKKVLTPAEQRLLDKPPTNVKEYVERTVEAQKRTFAEQLDIQKRKFIRMFTDTKGNLKFDLTNFEKFGQEGLMVRNYIINQGGTSSASQYRFDKHAKSIYSDIPLAAEPILDSVIFARRVLAVEQTKLDVARRRGRDYTPPEWPPGVSAKSATDHLNNLSTIYGISSDMVGKINRAADNYFAATRSEFQRLYDARIISQRTYDILNQYDYSLTDLINTIDPYREVIGVGTKGHGVRSSGVDTLKEIKNYEIYNTDYRGLLLEVVARTEGILATNHLNKLVAEMAKKHPKNGLAVNITSKSKAPHDWPVVDYYVDGKKRFIAIHPIYNKEFVKHRAELSSTAREALVAFSLSNATRLTATGANPAFAIAQVPMDMMSAWMHAAYYDTPAGGKGRAIRKHLYSDLLPVGIAQVIKDVAAVAPDVYGRKGIYLEYVEGGGLMNFLQTYGRLTQSGTKLKARDTKLSKVENVVGYIGLSNELMVRVGIYKRMKELMIKKGLSPADAKATAIATARDIRDYHTGGWAVKGADSVIPYLNASVLGLTKIAQEFRHNPVAATAKLSQVMGLGMAAHLASEHFFPGQVAQQNEYYRAAGWNFPLGLTIEDELGRERPLYLHLAKDHAQAPVAALGAMAAHMMLTGEVPNTHVLEQSLRRFLPLDVIPPTIKAFQALTGNYHERFKQMIYKGPELADPGQEYSAHFAMKHPYYTAIGEALGVSPERVYTAVGSIFADNPAFDLVGILGGYLHESGVPRHVREDAFLASLSDSPIVSRFLKVGDPDEPTRHPLEDIQKEYLLNRAVQNRDMDIAARIVNERRVGSDGTEIGMSAVRDVLRKYPDPAIQERLMERFLTARTAHMHGLHNARWWLTFQNANPEGRAMLLTHMMKEQDPTIKAEFRRGMSYFGNLITADVWTEFAKLRRKQSE